MASDIGMGPILAEERMMASLSIHSNVTPRAKRDASTNVCRESTQQTVGTSQLPPYVLIDGNSGESDAASRLEASDVACR
jgi:hypothetical protein